MLAVTVAAVLLIANAAAATLTVDFLFPTGGRQGTTVSLTAGGKFDTWPAQVWTDSPGIKAKPGEKNGTFTFEIAKDAPTGPHLVRFHDPTGGSACRVFVIGDLRELAEAEPNDELAKAQPAGELPVTIEGRLEKNEDVDSYSVKLEAGQCLVAAMQGRRLGSPIDPLLHLYDAAGNPLAFQHDGLGLDPLLVYRATCAGTFTVRIAAFAFPPQANVRFAGSSASVYRLTLSTTPPPRFATPAGIRRGTKGNVTLSDWLAPPDATPARRDVDATTATPSDDAVTVAAFGGDAILRLVLGDGPELVESEVNGSAASAPAPLAPPFGVTGYIGGAGEEDTYRFTAGKGERLRLNASAAAVASPLDAVLRVEDETGKRLAGNDDKATAGDAQLDWTAPADGTYRVVVGEVTRRGGLDYRYRLAIRRPQPGVEAAVTGDEFRVSPGKSVTIPLKAQRIGDYSGGVVAVATGLPAGVTGTAADVPEKGGDVSITLTAAADAKPACGPIRVVLLSTDVSQPGAWPAWASLEKEASQQLVSRTQALWLTVVLADAPAGDKK